MTGPAGPGTAPGEPERADRPESKAEQTAEQELGDALYYLRTDCLTCAERHFERARQLGASEEAIAAIRAKQVGA